MKADWIARSEIFPLLKRVDKCHSKGVTCRMTEQEWKSLLAHYPQAVDVELDPHVLSSYLTFNQTPLLGYMWDTFLVLEN